MAELKKVLSKKAIILITINSIMGTGIFFLPAVGAKISGAASILAWLFLSLVSIYIGMCFGELSGMYPKEGGIYEFSKQAYGTFWSFLIGWVTIIAGNITVAMLIVGAVQYLHPNDFSLISLELFYLPISISVNIALAVLFLILFNYVAYRGMKVSAMMLVVFSIITLSTLFLLIVPGLFRLDPANYAGIISSPLPPILLTIFFIAETFFGWETTTFLAGETKDGEKVMPFALKWGTIAIAIVCLSFVVTSLGVINHAEFGASTTPLTDLGVVHYGPIGKPIFTVLVFLSIIGSVAGWVVSAPRLLMAMASDKLFISSAAKVHEKFGTPYNAIIFQTIASIFILVAAAGKYTMLLEMLVPLMLILYSIVLLSLVVLRIKKPHVSRPYKVPFGRIGPILVVLFLNFLVFLWVQHNSHDALSILKLIFSFILLGIPIFLLLVIYYDPDIIIRLNDFFAYINLAFERLLLPKQIIRIISEHVYDLDGKKILEFGCGVGTLTKELARDVGPEGHVYATDISYNSVRIAQARINKQGHGNVTFIHDIHQVNRVHHSIPKVDAVISFGMLGYIQDLRKVLGEVHDLLPDGGRIIFIDFVDLFKIIPNVSWLSKEEELASIFRAAGFSVRVRKHTTPLWNYLVVYGIKTKEDVPFV